MNIDIIFKILGILAVYAGAVFLSLAICASLGLSFFPSLLIMVIVLFLAQVFLESIPYDN